MAYINPTYLYKLQNEHQAVFWKVYDSVARVPINEQTEDISLEDSQDKLKSTIENCSGDYVNVKLYQNKPKRKTAGDTVISEIHVKVKLGNSITDNSRQVSNAGLNGISLNDYISKIDEVRKLELEKLKMEIEHSQDKEQSKLEKILNKLLDNDSFVLGLTGVLKAIVTKGQAQTVSKPPQQALKPSTGNDDINQAVERLSKIDPDIVNTLNNLAAFAEKNPDALEQIKPILNQ